MRTRIWRRRSKADTALGRFGEVSDIASVVAFLASDAGRWVTAQVIEGEWRLQALTRAEASG
ncbi:SDR family oxidoreductase [Streptomyces sp. KL116D]|uniref:SDR family oxidoreductase n=1 Tax=Streptomyces sp. KL116D TaxID=3045152 RepID=UPI003555EBF7